MTTTQSGNITQIKAIGRGGPKELADRNGCAIENTRRKIEAARMDGAEQIHEQRESEMDLCGAHARARGQSVIRRYGECKGRETIGN